jgi:gluconolactonase
MASETLTAPAGARAELVAETDAHEGPVFVADEDALYFTTVRTDRVAIKRLDLASGAISVLCADANMANGMTLGPDGRLVVCEQGTLRTPARISAVDRDTGAVEVLAEGGLSSPNDVTVASDGAIWFTDPTYGWLQGFRPRPEHPDRIYRLDPGGRLEVVSEAFDKPNGLVFSPDERTLYVGDSGAIHRPDDYDPGRPRRVVALDLEPRRPTGPSNSVLQGWIRPEGTRLRVFADGIPGFPDGLKVASDGRVFVSSADGIVVFQPDGSAAGEIPLPGAVNFAFGAGESVLYVTADTAVWAVRLHTEGA